MDTNTENTNVQTPEVKESKVNTLKETNYLYLAYYVLSFVVLFFKTFVLKTEAMNNPTYRIGFMQFANGIGWLYYLGTAIGLLSVFLKPLHFMEKLGAKVVSVINFVVTLVLLLITLPDSVRYGGSITFGFWVILFFHALAVLVFWYQFIKARLDKKKD